jgi:hypothetical protein
LTAQTLEEALETGRGIERPIRCPSPEHVDTHASASVNVAKGVWFCFSCSARGAVDNKRVPTDAELAEMLKPDELDKVYPSAWLELFGTGGYWLSRFPEWLCWHFGLGEDPITGDATFPVYTPRGLLAGVGRRRQDPGEGPRYVYPRGWSASQTVWGPRSSFGVLVLTEGVADAVSLWEVGIPAFACYGAGVHLSQVKQIAALAPRLVLLGFDADPAGERAAGQAAGTLADIVDTARVDWSLASEKDPADLLPGVRAEIVSRTVGGTTYGDQAVTLSDDWAGRASTLRASYDTREE